MEHEGSAIAIFRVKIGDVEFLVNEALPHRYIPQVTRMPLAAVQSPVVAAGGIIMGAKAMVTVTGVPTAVKMKSFLPGRHSDLLCLNMYCSSGSVIVHGYQPDATIRATLAQHTDRIMSSAISNDTIDGSFVRRGGFSAALGVHVIRPTDFFVASLHKFSILMFFAVEHAGAAVVRLRNRPGLPTRQRCKHVMHFFFFYVRV